MASLEEQLKAVKLKKSDKPMKDFSSAKTAGFLKEEEIKEYEEHVLEVNTEHWLDILETETFPTVYCEFKLEEAEIFMDIYKRVYMDMDPSVSITTDWKEKISESEKDILDKLAVRLEEAMKSYTTEGYAFVKTSSRSAKDAPLVQGKFKQMYLDELEKHSDEDQSENMQISCLLKAAFSALRVKSAEEVLDMFLRSQRIYQDLYLAAINQKDKYNENFVIRKFVDIDIDMEFRGFVYDNELVALSQYNYLICSPRLVNKKQHYGQLVKSYYDNTVKPKLMKAEFPRNLIVDFAICEEGAKLWVIEINPYLETTDGALFSWQHERHLLEGKEGYQFRITEKPKPGAKAMLPYSLRTMMEENKK